jgi:hypothetical protein
MLQFIQVIVLLCFSQIACTNMSLNEQTKEVFVQKVEDGLNNYIEFIKEGDSLKGVFYGVEAAPSSKKPIYYKSVLSDIKIEAGKMKFILSTFSFSSKSFYGSQDDALLMKDQPDDIPFVYKFPIQYVGDRKGDTLKLNRLTMQDNSGFTEATFIKEK